MAGQERQMGKIPKWQIFLPRDVTRIVNGVLDDCIISKVDVSPKTCGKLGTKVVKMLDYIATIVEQCKLSEDHEDIHNELADLFLGAAAWAREDSNVSCSILAMSESIRALSPEPRTEVKEPFSFGIPVGFDTFQKFLAKRT